MGRAAAHARSRCVVLVKVVCNSQEHPVASGVGADAQHLRCGVHEPLYVSDLHLDVAQVPEEIHVLWVPLEGVQIAFRSLVVVSVGFVEDAINMPAHVGLHVCFQCSLCELVGFRAPVWVQEKQIYALHGQRLSVVGAFLQDLHALGAVTL